MTLLAWCVAWMLDFIIGDPPRWPHPVRWIGNLITLTQRIVRRYCHRDRALRIGVDVLPSIPQDTTDRNRTSPLAFTLLTVVGAAYLLYLAWLSFRAGASMAHLQESRFLGYWGLYRRGVIMNITNPKVTLFFLAFLPQFCAPERGSVALQVMELGLLFMLAAFLVFTAVSALGGRLAHWFNSSPRGQMLMHRVAGLVFVALAVMLIFSCVA